ncbi:methyl-accepting chemotaxis protein [Colwelliaceae bacterium MEBiC 14330]
MQFLKSLSIRYKILLIPMVAALGFIFYLLISFYNVEQAKNNLTQAQSVDFPLLQISQDVLVKLDKVKEVLGNAATMGEADLLVEAQNIATELSNQLKLAANIDKNLAAELNAQTRNFEQYFQRAFRLSQSMVDGTADFSVIGQQSQEMSEKLQLLQTSLIEFKERRSQAFEAAFVNVESRLNSTNKIGVAVALITITILMLVAVPVANIIRKNLGEVIESMRAIAQENGDLTVRLSTTSEDEIGELVLWFNNFIEKLQNVIKDIVETAGPLAKSAKRIEKLSGSASNTAEQQKSLVYESKLSVEQMSAVVSEISSNAAEAASATQSANVESDKGKEVVEKAVTSIKALHENIGTSSEMVHQLQDDTNKVNVVLEVIRAIAEQTNLLALNAAIEAARAGEQGRGFAVVADEVRSLASRTQDSTQEINQILGQLQSAAENAVAGMQASIDEVETSVTNTIAAGDSLLSIKDTVDTITRMNEQIATATEEQQQTSVSMVDNVAQINEKAEAASKGSNDLNDVSVQLANLASELELITQQFKV